MNFGTPAEPSKSGRVVPFQLVYFKHFRKPVGKWLRVNFISESRLQMLGQARIARPSPRRGHYFLMMPLHTVLPF